MKAQQGTSGTALLAPILNLVPVPLHVLAHVTQLLWASQTFAVEPAQSLGGASADKPALL